MKYIVIEVNESNRKEIFEKLYNGSAMTVQGMIFDELPLYINHFKENCGLHDNINVYHFLGKQYNDHYELTGKNRLPNELNCISIELDDMDNCMGARQLIRWFDDIVDNDLRREGRGE